MRCDVCTGSGWRRDRPLLDGYREICLHCGGSGVVEPESRPVLASAAQQAQGAGDRANSYPMSAART
jgi:hypothetical protein